MALDPYLSWLGIREKQRPLDHYRLLGIGSFEADPQRIAAAAERQIQRVRAHESGEHAELARRVLNELAAARRCLLEPGEKAAYDARLQATAAGPTAVAKKGDSGRWRTEPAEPGGESGSHVVPAKPKPILVAKPLGAPAAQPLPSAPIQRPSAPLSKTPVAAAALTTAGQPLPPAAAGVLPAWPLLRIAAIVSALIVLAALVAVFAMINMVPPVTQGDVQVAIDRSDLPPDQVVPPPAIPPSDSAAIEDRVPLDDTPVGEEPADVEQPTPAEVERNPHTPPPSALVERPPASPVAAVGPAPWDMPPQNRPTLDRSVPGYTLSQEVHTHLSAARDAMRRRDLYEAQRHMAQSRSTARRADEQREADRLEQCWRELDGFWRAVQDGVRRTAPGQQLVYRDVPVIVVSCDSKTIGIRDAANRTKFFSAERDQMDRDLALAVVAASPGYLGTRKTLAIAAFEAFDRAGFVEKVADACMEARRRGLPVDHVMDEALYDFSRVKVDSPRTLADLVDPSQPPAGDVEMPPPVKEKRPLPGQPARDKAEEEIEELFAAGYRSRDPGQKIKLAKELLRQARTTNEDAPRYVLLEQAGKMAGTYGDAETAVTALSQLYEEFEVTSVETAGEVVEDLSRKQFTPDVAEYVVEFTLKLAWLGVMYDDFRSASKLLTGGQLLLRSTQTPELLRLVQTAREEMSYVQREFRRVEGAQQVLENVPNDPQANSTVGRYLCLVKGKFAEALPHLEKGNAGKLTEIVRLEVEQPADLDKRLALAEGWWEIAGEEKNPASRWALIRSGAWYEKALPSLAGLAKTRAQERLSQVQQVANAAGLLRPNKGLDKLIVGMWKVTWRYPPPSENVDTEYLSFDAAQTYSRSRSILGNWSLQGTEIVAPHGSYMDRFRMINPNQIVAVRLRNGMPYMQGVGVRYESSR